MYVESIFELTDRINIKMIYDFQGESRIILIKTMKFTIRLSLIYADFHISTSSREVLD